MGMMYAVSVVGVASPAAIWDVMELNVPADAVVKIHSVYLGQTTDMGDAAAEALTVQLIRGHATSGSGGSTATPVPKLAGNAAAGTTVETNNTTIASTGTAVIMHADVWNIALPWQYRPTPEERDELSPSSRLVIRVSAPADAITTTCTVIFEELGG